MLKIAKICNHQVKREQNRRSPEFGINQDLSCFATLSISLTRFEILQSLENAPSG